MAQAPNGGCQIGVNLGFTRFLFFSLPGDDDAIVARLRAAAGMIARGFFNDFEGDSNGSLSHETIQFLVNERWQDQSGVPGSRYALQISSKYRPRLQDTEKELRRRLNGEIGVVSIEGAVRAPQYTSPAMHEYAFRHALVREALYAELLPGEREALHDAVLGALEQRDGGAVLAMAAVCRSFPVALLAKRQDADHGASTERRG